MKLPGGGPLGMGPGQITDDSEMAQCLFQAFTEDKDEGDAIKLNLNQI
jgi:ADP-ribosylglycohydrolase